MPTAENNKKSNNAWVGKLVGKIYRNKFMSLSCWMHMAKSRFLRSGVLQACPCLQSAWKVPKPFSCAVVCPHTASVCDRCWYRVSVILWWARCAWAPQRPSVPTAPSSAEHHERQVCWQQVVLRHVLLQTSEVTGCDSSQMQTRAWEDEQSSPRCHSSAEVLLLTGSNGPLCTSVLAVHEKQSP